MWFFSSPYQLCDIIECVYEFELVSQVSDVAHGPLVAISLLSSLGKVRSPSFEQLNYLHPRMLCAKFG